MAILERSLSDMSDAELSNLADNYVRLERTGEPRYQTVLEVLQLRRAPELSIDVTISTILAAAKERRFLSYGQVAAANGCVWDRVRRAMPRHLDLVLAKAHARGAPLITSIVVNQNNLKAGDLETASLAGFLASSRRQHVIVDEEQVFLRQQQEATFLFAEAGNRI